MKSIARRSVRPRTVLSLAVAALALGLPAARAAEAEGVASSPDYSILEVARFEVHRGDFSSKVAERAGRIPEEMLDQIQRALLVELQQDKPLPTVRKAGDSGEETGRVLLLGGRVVDFLGGDRMKRYFVGFGAGQQKIEVQCTLTDPGSGKVLGQETILDRKVAGLGGGSEDKGVRDFAEKVRDFIRRTLAPPGKER